MDTETIVQSGSEEVAADAVIEGIDDLDGAIIDGPPEPGLEEEENEPDESGAESDVLRNDEGKVIPQEKINERINKKHLELMEAREANERLAKEKSELEAKLAEINKPGGLKPVPDIPDSFDPDFHEKLQERDRILVANSEYEHRVRLNQAAIDKVNYEKSVQEEKVRTEKVNSYRERIAKFGLDEAKLTKAESNVVRFLPNQDVKQFILEDDNGPLIVQHLNDNPVELTKVATMNPIAAALYLKETVSKIAKKLQPNPTSTPDPIRINKGRAAPDETHPDNVGATFE